MRKLILLTALMIPLFVQAARPDTCLHVKNVASLVMEWRQDGVEADSAVLSISQAQANEQMYRAYIHIVIDAYQTRRYETEMYRRNVIKEFANKYYIACWKGTV
tara:strand:- start:923 stop:1234 length:312 start_codon:yes stop_codon:yes gene_type:complete